MLSRMYLDQNRFGYNVTTTIEDALDRSEEYARQAIEYARGHALPSGAAMRIVSSYGPTILPT